MYHHHTQLSVDGTACALAPAVLTELRVLSLTEMVSLCLPSVGDYSSGYFSPGSQTSHLPVLFLWTAIQSFSPVPKERRQQEAMKSSVNLGVRQKDFTL